MSSSVVQLFLLALISTVTADGVTRLLNGNVADPGQFPFLASIRIMGAHLCGGSIIHPQFILTAGHCARDASRVNINDVTVLTGSVQLSEGGTTSNVAKMLNAADNDDDIEKDIGLIKLTVPLVYDNYTRKISYSLPSDDLPNNEFGTVIGWGRTTSNTKSDMLQYMYAYITDRSCAVLYKTKHIICTNNGPTYGVCYGDDGSPLIYKGKIIGVASRAVSRKMLCGKGLLDAYSSTAHNINFIRYTLATEQ